MEKLNFTIFIEIIQKYGLEVLYAALILLLGWFIARYMSKLLHKFLLNSKLDNYISIIISKTLFWLIFIAFIIASLKQIGIHTTSFIAVFGTVALGISLSCQKSFSNFATGVMLMIFRPFKVGDNIKTLGYEGKVKEIKLFHTIIHNSDNEIIILPNNKIMDSPISRYK